MVMGWEGRGRWEEMAGKGIMMYTRASQHTYVIKKLTVQSKHPRLLVYSLKHTPLLTVNISTGELAPVTHPS